MLSGARRVKIISRFHRLFCSSLVQQGQLQQRSPEKSTLWSRFVHKRNILNSPLEQSNSEPILFIAQVKISHLSHLHSHSKCKAATSVSQRRPVWREPSVRIKMPAEESSERALAQMQSPTRQVPASASLWEGRPSGCYVTTNPQLSGSLRKERPLDHFKTTKIRRSTDLLQI